MNGVNMKIYDISVALSADLPVFPGDPPVAIEPVMRIARGDGANLSRISISSHCGTHLDPPRHFNDNGMTMDQVPLSLLMGEALLLEFSGIKSISRADLEKFAIKDKKRLLLKTDNSALWRKPLVRRDFCHLTEDGALYLVEMGIRLVGIDYLSVERVDGDGSVHHRLLDNGVIILEGLDMEGVPPGEYELICLPLKIEDGDGAPARAILIAR
jgi:arylformamidase